MIFQQLIRILSLLKGKAVADIAGRANGLKKFQNPIHAASLVPSAGQGWIDPGHLAAMQPEPLSMESSTQIEANRPIAVPGSLHYGSFQGQVVDSDL
jgi:hypothetical protein